MVDDEPIPRDCAHCEWGVYVYNPFVEIQVIVGCLKEADMKVSGCPLFKLDEEYMESEDDDDDEDNEENDDWDEDMYPSAEDFLI